MSKLKTTRPTSRKSDRQPTAAEARRAKDKLIRDGAYAVPRNPLVYRNPAETITACRRVIDYLAHIEKPFDDEELDVGESYITQVVVDALRHVETQIDGFWAQRSQTNMKGKQP